MINKSLDTVARTSLREKMGKIEKLMILNGFVFVTYR